VRALEAAAEAIDDNRVSLRRTPASHHRPYSSRARVALRPIIHPDPFRSSNACEVVVAAPES